MCLAKKSIVRKVSLFHSGRTSKEPASQALSALSCGVFVAAGLPSEMSSKEELQCCTHYPFMDCDNWLNNTSFCFYKVHKSHQAIPMDMVSGMLPTALCPAQLPTERYAGSKLSTGKLQGRGAVRIGSCEERKEQLERAGGSPHLGALQQSCLQRRWSRAGPFGLRLEALPSLPYTSWKWGSASRHVYFIIFQQ